MGLVFRVLPVSGTQSLLTPDPPPSYRVTVSWLQSAALISFLSGFPGGVGLEVAERPAKIDPLFFSAGGRKEGREEGV